jgi:hypothetical protein
MIPRWRAETEDAGNKGGPFRSALSLMYRRSLGWPGGCSSRSTAVAKAEIMNI